MAATSLFSSTESETIERTVDTNGADSADGLVQLADIWPDERRTECTDWIRSNGHQRVCLQFPDELLRHSARITRDLRSDLAAEGTQLFILGDTSYGSCCVDEIAAQHANADAMVHFGHACLSRSVRLPLLYVFYSRHCDAAAFAGTLQAKCTDDERPLFVFYDVGYFYELDKLRSACTALKTPVHFGQLALHTSADRLGWTLPDSTQLAGARCVYIGRDDQTLFNLTLGLAADTQSADWLLYDPRQPSQLLAKTPQTSAWMRRRNYYIETCKDARCLGIVVGTLAAARYLDVVQHLQTMARHRGVRTYLISVGKVNPAKLANFMEIDCFVLVGCPENQLFTSREFYKPLLSVYEVEMALNRAWQGELAPAYSLEFGDCLENGRLYRPYEALAAEEERSDVSLVTGRVRGVVSADANSDAKTDADGALLLRRNYEIVGVEMGAALRNRSWTGLDPALGQTDVAIVQEGRRGIAIKYEENVATMEK